MDYLIDEFKRDQGIDLHNDRQALQRLKEAAEKAKIELSTVMETEINLPYITADANGPKHLLIRLSRAKMDQLTNELVERTIPPVEKALSDASLKPSEVNEVVLVGGMSRMPSVREIVRQKFGKESHKGVNPDEVVAIGAAIQAGVLGGDVKDILLVDVTPLTLSIETLGGVATPIIERNTAIPITRRQIFSTASDSQTQVQIHVTQGERPMATDNKSLGQFILDGIPPAPRGIPQIEVTFDLDSNGILNVTAQDKATSRSQKITITASSGLTKDEIEHMKKEAESFADQDNKRKEMIEARNTADNTIYTTEKTIRDGGDKVPADAKKEAEEAITNLRKAMESDNVEEIRKQTEALGQILQKIGASMYQQPGAAGDQNGQPEQGSKPSDNTQDQGKPEDGEDVVDGEFKNV